MYIVKTLAFKDRDAFQGFTNAPLRKLLCDHTTSPESLAVGAFAWPSPIGLALVEFGREEHPVLRLVAVAKNYRRQGMARALLREVENELRRRGYSAVVVQHFVEGMAPSVALPALLASIRWTSMQPSGIFCKSTYSLIESAPWVRHHTFPPGFETFDWADLPLEEERLFVGADRGPSWFPEQLNPFLRRDLVHLPTSVGLRYRGELIGWCVTYFFGTNDLTVASLFVREQFQSRGHAIRLIAYSIRHAGGSGREDLSFNVAMGMTGMLQFFLNHMTPYVTGVRTLYRSVTSLSKLNGEIEDASQAAPLLSSALM